MNILLKWILSALLVTFVAWLIPGISITSFGSAMIAVVVISLINIFIKPVLKFISLPVNFLTLGLFGLILNALLFLLAAKIAPGLEIDGFWSALLGSFVISILTPVIEKVEFKKE